MKIHEYQAKEILKEYGVPVLNGRVVSTVHEAVEAAKKMGGKAWAVKAQIHAGGRGKAGGVRLARSLNEVEEAAEAILGKVLVTVQTGPEGKVVRHLLIEEATDVAHEYYLAILLDRESSKLVFLASTEGGMDIEKVAHKTPEKILKVTIDPSVGYTPSIARKVGFWLGLKGPMIENLSVVLKNLYRLYLEKDCTVVEINPLITTHKNEILALDAKINFDDNSLERHKEFEALRDPNEEDAVENEAQEYGLSYVSLNGNIGCMVNGAGLAMATMDIIKLHGGNPANFLDVGGSATKEAIEQGFKMILKDTKVKAIFVNIFGGIMKCDVVAEGIVAAIKGQGVKVPLVVRLEGTNVALGKKILKDEHFSIITADDLHDAAEKVVKEALK